MKNSIEQWNILLKIRNVGYHFSQFLFIYLAL